MLIDPTSERRLRVSWYIKQAMLDDAEKAHILDYINHLEATVIMIEEMHGKFIQDTWDVINVDNVYGEYDYPAQVLRFLKEDFANLREKAALPETPNTNNGAKT